jgi:CBS-domain-containing membrane protein
MQHEASCALVALALLNAADVMTTDPTTVADHESLAAAWEVLARGGVGFLPVSRRGRVVGVLDDRAVVHSRTTKWLDGRPRLVGDAVRRVASIRPWTPMPELLERFTGSGDQALVVVDDDDRAIGLVLATTVLALFEQAMARGHSHGPIAPPDDVESAGVERDAPRQLRAPVGRGGEGQRPPEGFGPLG